MLRNKLSPLVLCLVLAACGSHASPEDVQMATSLSAQGKTLLSAGKTSDARDIYLSAVARDEKNGRAWNGLGVSYDLLGKKDKAEDAYQRAIDLNPGDLVATNNLAHLYLERGDAEAAFKLLNPHANDPAVSETFKQNLATAAKAVQNTTALNDDIYAELGSYPTDGMAQGHVAQAKKLLGSDAKDLTFTIVPEVKVGGGTPVFTAKITGDSPQSICDNLSSQAIPCIPHGKAR